VALAAVGSSLYAIGGSARIAAPDGIVEASIFLRTIGLSHDFGWDQRGCLDGRHIV
jgi:hypothetical protein